MQRSILLELDEADSGAIFGLFLAISGASILGQSDLDADGRWVFGPLVTLGVTLVIAVPLIRWSHRRRRSRNRRPPTTDAITARPDTRSRAQVLP